MKDAYSFDGCIAILIATIQLARRDAIEPKDISKSGQAACIQRDAQLFLHTLDEQTPDLVQFVDLSRCRPRYGSIRWL